MQELTTNIHDLHTSGLLNSHASRWTTTNVGHLLGDRHSVMTLSELNSITDKLAAAAAAAKKRAAAAATNIIDDSADALKAEAVKVANILIDDAEKQGHVITDDIRQKIVALTIQLKKGAKNGITQTRHQIDAKLDPLKTGPISTAVINEFEKLEPEIDEDAMQRIKEILDLLSNKAIYTVKDVDSAFNDKLENNRPFNFLLV